MHAIHINVFGAAERVTMMSGRRVRSLFTTVYTKQELEQYLEQSELNVLWFTADWCGPCKRIEPLCKTIGERSDVNMIEINIDKAAEIAAHHSICSIPSFKFFRQNEQVYPRLLGANQEKLSTTIAELTAK